MPDSAAEPHLPTGRTSQSFRLRRPKSIHFPEEFAVEVRACPERVLLCCSNSPSCRHLAYSGQALTSTANSYTNAKTRALLGRGF